jgi:methyl-accepting chemotaxis protein
MHVIVLAVSDPSTLLEIFTGVVAVSLLLQSLALVGIHRSIRSLASRVEAVSLNLVKNVDALSVKVDQLLATIKGMADGVHSLQENLTTTSAIVQKRVAELDSFLAEIADVARLQVLRIQDIVDTTSRRVEETIDVLSNSVLAPVTEVNAIVRGVKVGLDVLLRKRKSPSSSTPQDEEMFI